MTSEERWPPIYDADGLAATIGEIVRRGDLRALYQTLGLGGPCCQGDVLRLANGVPVLEADGSAQVADDFTHWLEGRGVGGVAGVLSGTDVTRVLAARNLSCLSATPGRHHSKRSSSSFSRLTRPGRRR